MINQTGSHLVLAWQLPGAAVPVAWHACPTAYSAEKISHPKHHSDLVVAAGMISRQTPDAPIH